MQRLVADVTRSDVRSLTAAPPTHGLSFPLGRLYYIQYRAALAYRLRFDNARSVVGSVRN